ncbi:ABC transporter ATP-binding protein [Limobrevibacterium gyesilva]|uniref:ABC transporter ATP-binding protein n=1 Tax=Limobrevibacterium gyesilva TaxID=2991712 RepID=A0AA41YH82_9PROT|nr:ABC transporter ATP-binding protein [Limobrevibacterium gyesilva]MCW3473211.1 ABC transporter ATP-binding protein [Limobrevibacterium gyesilva]
MTHLVLEGLTRAYGGRPVVQGVSLSVERGSLLALLGPSGCGKTTTLRMVAGLEAPDAGRILVEGRDVTPLAPHRRRMGVVFQSYALFPHMTAAANVAFGLEMHGVPRGERVRRAAEALTLVGLADHAQKRPRQLSGGQQQRVALARALAIEPDVLLLDEPLSALDAKLREELRSEMRAIQQRVGATSVFVTHDQAEALAMADMVAVMDQGRIAQLGTPEDVFERPRTPFVATFVGRSARFAGQAEGGAVRAGGMAIHAAGLPATGAVEVFVRPHRIRVLADGDTAENALDGTIAAIDYTGEVAQLQVDTPVGRVPVDVATADGAWRARQPGQPIRLGWRATDTIWFAA